MNLRPARCALAAAAALLALPAAHAAASDTIYGLTADNGLVTFNASTPGNLERDVQLSGMAPSETLIGVDVRPANDQVYVLGTTSRIYLANPVTGRLRTVGMNNPFSPALAGTQFGLDFNPMADRLRIVTDADQNLRLNADTGQGTGEGGSAADGTLAYMAGDPNAGQNPTMAATAYTNNTPGATMTAQFNIDSERNILVRQNPPNAGTLQTIGALGVDVSAPLGFDIAQGDGTAYLASKRSATAEGSNLFRVDLATGRATPAAPRNRVGTDTLRAIAVAGPAAAVKSAPVFSVAVSSTQLDTRLLRRGLEVSASCDAACDISGRVRSGGSSSPTATATIANRAGRTTVRFPLNAATRSRIRSGNALLTLRISATDSAGNVRSQTRAIRSQTLRERRG